MSPCSSRILCGVLVLVAAAGWADTACSAQSAGQTQNESVPAAYVADCDGRTEYRRNVEDPWMPLHADTWLPANAEVRTGSTGCCTLIFPDSAVAYIEPDTAFDAGTRKRQETGIARGLWGLLRTVAEHFTDGMGNVAAARAVKKPDAAFRAVVPQSGVVLGGSFLLAWEDNARQGPYRLQLLDTNAALVWESETDQTSIRVGTNDLSLSRDACYTWKALPAKGSAEGVFVGGAFRYATVTEEDQIRKRAARIDEQFSRPQSQLARTLALAQLYLEYRAFADAYSVLKEGTSVEHPASCLARMVDAIVQSQ